MGSDDLLNSFHIDEEFRSLIPALTEEEYIGLKKSVVVEGCRDALVVWNDTIIDGHNRYEICKEYNLEFDIIEMKFASREDAKIWIIQNQFARRNLDAWQRSKLALKLKPLIAAKAKERQEKAGKEHGRGQDEKLPQKSAKAIDTREELAKAAGVSHDTIAKAEKIDAEATPEQKEKLDKGEASINQVYGQVRTKERREKQAAMKEAVKEQLIPEKKYGTIVIDPPWPVEKTIREVRPNQNEFDYPTMSIEEIQEFGKKVGKMAAHDCHLFMWTTEKYLPHSFEILKAWGFRYIFTMVWHKNGGYQPFNLAQYNCEFVLYARKGTPEFVETKDFFCCFNGQRREHSRKPDEFYQTIARVTKELRIDIFSRGAHDGFDQYGNEIDKF